VTVDKGVTHWLTSEFGAGLALSIAVTAWLFWRVRDAIESPNDSLVNVQPIVAPSVVIAAER